MLVNIVIVSYPYVRSQDIVMLWLFLFPVLLIPNTISAGCAVFIFTGNSSERDRQTWIVEMTCRERPMSVCFAWECEVLQITRNHVSSIASDCTCCQENRSGHYEDDEKNTTSNAYMLFRYIKLHVISCNLTSPDLKIWMWWDIHWPVFVHHHGFFKFLKFGENISCFLQNDAIKFEIANSKILTIFEPC